MHEDRRPSPLAAAGGAPWDDIPTPPSAPSPTPRDQRKQSRQSRGAAAPRASGEVIRIQEGSRRKRVSTKGVDPFELRPVNYNLPVVTRRELRRFAAEHDVDIQDVVNDALIRYFELFGIRVPRTREELDQADQASDLR